MLTYDDFNLTDDDERITLSNMTNTNNPAEHPATQWIASPTGYDTTSIGRYTVNVWTGSPAQDLDDGFEVFEAYIPTTDRDFPDGKMLVTHRRLDTRCRETARTMAIGLARAAIADFESRWR